MLDVPLMDSLYYQVFETYFKQSSELGNVFLPQMPQLALYNSDLEKSDKSIRIENNGIFVNSSQFVEEILQKHILSKSNLHYLAIERILFKTLCSTLLATKLTKNEQDFFALVFPNQDINYRAGLLLYSDTDMLDLNAPSSHFLDLNLVFLETYATHIVQKTFSTEKLDFMYDYHEHPAPFRSFSYYINQIAHDNFNIGLSGRIVNSAQWLPAGKLQEIVESLDEIDSLCDEHLEFLYK